MEDDLNFSKFEDDLDFFKRKHNLKVLEDDLKVRTAFFAQPKAKLN